MNVVICGAGEVGRHSAEILGGAGHNITIIDRRAAKLRAIEEEMDVQTLRGNGAQAELLREAGVADADLFIAATNVDEINLLSGGVASHLGAAKVIARVHHSAYFDERGMSYTDVLGITHLVCPDYTTALEIAQALRSPGALAVEQFARGRIEIQELPVSDGAPAVGKPLMEVKLPTRCRLAAVSRHGQAFIPRADTTLQERDVVTLIGDVEYFEKARALFVDQPTTRVKVMIMGGTALGVWLCRQLKSKRFSVRLFEQDRKRCAQLAQKLDWVTILNADPASSTILEEEHVEQVDAFVALTDDDEQNILAAARAKSMGVSEVMAVLQRGTYLHLLSHVGIDRAFSPRVTAVAEIQRLIDESKVKHMASLAKGIADVFEVDVTGKAENVLEVPLREIAFPPNCMVAGIQRGEEVTVPGAEEVIKAGDRVIMIGPSDATKSLRKFFGVR